MRHSQGVGGFEEGISSLHSLQSPVSFIYFLFFWFDSVSDCLSVNGAVCYIQ